jgi:cytochrome b subunit of formate dehydrogenase
LSRRVRDWVHVLLSFSVFLFLVSGIGIVEHRLVTSLSFGLLTKDRSYVLHTVLVYPFVILLFLHVYVTLASRFGR